MNKNSLLALGALFFSAAAAADTIEIQRQGTAGARPLVFIPGLASSAEVFSRSADRFGKTHDVHLVSVRGFAGVSASGPLTLAAIADDLAMYLDRQDLNDAVLVGHSAGGMIAMQTAVRSDHVGELVLVESLPFTAALFVAGITPEAAAATANSVRTAMQATSEEAFRAQQRAGLAVYTRSKDFLATLTHWSDASDMGAVIDIYADLIATDYRDQLAAIDIPIHVIAAWDESMNVPREDVEEIFRNQYASHAKTDVIVIEDTFHFVMIDQPAEFESSLARVLGDVR